jgi:cyclopropane-fatty-acyl-phospholipid synthase
MEQIGELEAGSDRQPLWALVDPMKRRLDQALALAGITLNGTAHWDPQVRNPRVYFRLLLDGTLGAGEAYMDGWWECEALDEFAARILSHNVREQLGIGWPLLVAAVSARLMNPQSRSRAWEIGKRHYDIGNALYEAMLGRTMTYSCGYWGGAADLDEAQEAKLDLACQKLGLRPGLRVLDIGCGWGSFAKHAAERYGVSVVGLTVSQEQATFAARLCAGLPVEIRLQDYRAVDDTFDRIVSIGMFEHVGVRNYRTYFERVRRCLAADGLFLLHSIGGLHSTHSVDPWIGKHIFPNSMLPSASQISRAAEGLFVIEDWHNFGADYDKTLMAWWRNFDAAWPTLRAQYDERFYRMWRYYLLTCAGSFRTRSNQLWQIVLSPRGVAGGYRRLGN